jgi:hypothetical protein
VISRRTFLIVTAATSAVAAVGYVAKPYVRSELLPKLDAAFPPGALTGTEMRDIVALGESIAAPEFLPPARFFSDYVDAVTRNQPGFLKEYKGAVVLLTVASARVHDGGVSQHRFADLSFGQRDKALQTLLWRYSRDDDVTRKIEKFVCSRNTLAFRIFVMSPLIEHYYRSAYGWQAMGYESFPGRPPLDPRAYARPIPD